MKGYLPIAIVVAVFAAVPLVVHSNVVLNFLVVTLMIALAGQGWNILGGYGGQYCLGLAPVFGARAYVASVLALTSPRSCRCNTASTPGLDLPQGSRPARWPGRSLALSRSAPVCAAPI